MRSRLVLAALCSFACATGYGSRGMMFGYSDTQMGENTFRVSFEGNGYTPLAKVSDFALLRSAEVTLEHGYPYFLIVNGHAGGATPTVIQTIACYKTAPTDASAIYEAATVRRSLREKYGLGAQ
jgi:hypothetical protein